MNEKMFAEKIKNGWEHGETEKHQQDLSDFLRGYLRKEKETVDASEKKTDYGSHLEFSGGKSDIWAGLRSGDLLPKTVSVLYEKGEIKQIHGYFETQSNGHNLDVYLTETALDDYLKKFNPNNN